MSTNKQKIRESVRNMVASMIPMTNRWVTVVKVDEDKGLMDCKSDGGVEYYDILLSLDNTNGVMLVPEVDSKVAIGMFENSDTDGFLIMADKVEAIVIKISQGFIIRVDKSGVATINGDNYGGMAITPELLKRINAIEDDINNLKTLVNGWTPSPQDGGAALKGAASAWAGQRLTKTTIQDIENDKVKHGG